MQAPKNQRKYYCPYCEQKMKVKKDKSMQGDKVFHITCTNDNCDYSGIGWDIAKLEKYEINKIQRVEELLEV